MPHRTAALLCSLLSLLLFACGSGTSTSEDADASQPDAALESPDAALPADAGALDAGALDAGEADAGEEPPPADHTLMLGGVAHQTGHTDPLTACSACHGTSLNGGSASSCYSCHDTSDHTLSFHRVPHKQGTESSCEVCHGPSNGGGLGPACSDCH